jgi:ubiquinone/menaquinone biosynthesis C-methylase UbiE
MMTGEVTSMDKPMSGAGFKLMGLMFKVRDLVRPRLEILEEAGIKPGHQVLDYGCGPGSYIFPAAQLVGPAGRVYALDINPLAVRQVVKIADSRGLMNVDTIESDCRTGLPDGELDVVLLYDTFHDLSHPDEVLRELHRVLKPGGTLSFTDHHMREKDILERLTAAGLFKPAGKGERTYSFLKAG